MKSPIFSSTEECLLRQLFGPTSAAIGVFLSNGAILRRSELPWDVARLHWKYSDNE